MTVKGISVFNGTHIEVEIENNAIASVRELKFGDEQSLPFISPGFFDIQCNGYKGINYSGNQFNGEQLHQLQRYLAVSGTTSHLPTIITSSMDLALRNLEIIGSELESNPLLEKAVPGVHLEGPYITSEDGARGVHNQEAIRDPDYSEFTEMQEASGNRVRLITLAPERKGAIPFIEKVVSQGVRVALGHTVAEAGIIRDAIKAGATLSTHLGNGSQVYIPRLNNYIWEQLAEDDLYASIISDGYHLPSSVLKVFARAKALSRIILVSDVSHLGGYEPGIYTDGPINVEVHGDGHLTLSGTSLFAGAGHLLNRCIPVFCESIGVSLGEAVTLCTKNPAKFLGISKSIPAKIESGQRADLTLFRYRGEDVSLSVEKTFASGKLIYTES